MYYYVLLTTGVIVRTETPFSFNNDWSDNIDVAIRLPNVDHSDPHAGFYTAINFSFKRDSAVAYWGI